MAGEEVRTLQEPLPFITLDEDSVFSISEEATAYLNQIEGPIAIVSIAGLYRTGKSYLLNLLLGRERVEQMFGVGGTVNAFTKGIWIWGKPLDQAKGSNLTVLFMDTEGMGSIQRSATQDTRIFALALLLSSYFIYNSRGVIDSSAIEDLSLVVNLSKYVQIKQDATQDESDLADFFPDFMWVVRDFTLQLEEDGKKITSRDYLEKALRPQGQSNGNSSESDGVTHKNHVRSLLSTFFKQRDCITMVRPLNDEKLLQALVHQPIDSLREEFLTQLESLRSKVFNSLKPKEMMARPINGRMLVSLAENYIECFNSGSTPVISTAWDRVITSQCEDALEEAQKFFKKSIKDQTQQLYEKSEEVNDEMCVVPMELLDVEAIFHESYSSAKEMLNNTTTAGVGSNNSNGFTIDSESLLPFETKLGDFMIEQMQHTVELNEKSSNRYNSCLFDELYAPILSKRGSYHAQSEEEAIQYLQSSLQDFKDFIVRLVETYQHNAKGPTKDNILGQRLAEKLAKGMGEWSSAVVKMYRVQHSRLQKKMAATKQELKKIEGKSKAIEDVLSSQKETYERTLANLSERMEEEKKSLRLEIDSKQGEINRVVDQIDKMTVLNREALDRVSVSIHEAKEEISQIEDSMNQERARRENDVKDVHRELLDTERSYHDEEKKIIAKQEEMMTRLVELESKIAQAETTQMRTEFTLETETNEKIDDLKAQHAEKIHKIKTQTIADIRSLKTKQDSELKALKDEVNQKAACLSASKETLNMKKQQKLQEDSKPKKKKDKDCCIQ